MLSTYIPRVSIDTLHLSARLSDEQKQYIYNRFTFNKNRTDWHWHYSQNETKSLGFTIHALPTNTYTYKHYDHTIQLQNQLIDGAYIPYSVNEILQNIDWNIKRIDLAFDFSTDIEKSFIMKHHGNVQFDNNDKWNTTYLGKLKSRSPSKVAHYDRNIKERERETNIEHEYNNRFEVRIFPKSNEKTMKLHNLSDNFIIKHLSKYIFIPDVESLPLSRWDKKRLYKIHQDYTYLKTLDKSKQKDLKSVVKAHRMPLEQFYINNKGELFSFLEKSSKSRKIAI